MKKIATTILAILSTTLIFAQTSSPKSVAGGKIILTPGQKIIVESNISMDADLSMGMQMNSTSSSENLLEAKNSNDKNYTISNTLTKVKVNMNMMGQPTSYDSEKKEDNNSDIGKSFEDKLNKPVDVTVDNASGKAIKEDKKEPKKEIKKDADNENPMNGLLDIFSQSSDDAVVTGAFELVPAGKGIGDSWQDSTVTKDIKTIRTYTLQSVTGNEALIQLDAITTASNKLELQGMEMEFKSETKSTSDIITDITTGQVKKRSTKADITGSIQLMGQDVPITAKATSNSTYK